MPRSAEKFVFVAPNVDSRTGSVTCSYQTDFKNGDSELTNEVFSFSPEVFHIEPKLLSQLFETLHLICGVSYWKRYCAPTIELQSAKLTAAQASFFNTLYTKGLGEFYFQNSIDFRNLVQFPASLTEAPAPTTVEVTPSALVPFGGGKDSIVVAEILKNENRPFELVTLNPLPLHNEAAEVVGHPLIPVGRKIDPILSDTVTKADSTADAFRGHVPMSAIYSCVALIVAIARGHSEIVFAAEESASHGNVEYLGMSVNHQWSKSQEFEKLFGDYVHRFVTPSISYYSKLRDMSELEVTKEFCRHSQYFAHFSSCNRNFATLAERRLSGTKWCGKCPKCAFVFLMLAAHLPRKTVTEIFGCDLFINATLAGTYRELLGWHGVKPFECVGTPEEVNLAFSMILARGEFNDSAILQLYLSKRSAHDN